MITWHDMKLSFLNQMLCCPICVHFLSHSNHVWICPMSVEHPQRNISVGRIWLLTKVLCPPCKNPSERGFTIRVLLLVDSFLPWAWMCARINHKQDGHIIHYLSVFDVSINCERATLWCWLPIRKDWLCGERTGFQWKNLAAVVWWSVGERQWLTLEDSSSGFVS